MKMRSLSQVFTEYEHRNYDAKMSYCGTVRYCGEMSYSGGGGSYIPNCGSKKSISRCGSNSSYEEDYANLKQALEDFESKHGRFER